VIGFDEALARVVAAAKPLGIEQVRLGEAHRRVLAKPVTALVDSPPADVSAMDGYAVRDADLPGQLRVIGESYPGCAFAGDVRAGECVRIFTGAPVPAGTDRVVIQEEATREGDAVSVGGAAGGRHIRARGADFSRADTLLHAGRRLDARALVAAAGADLAEVEVWRRPGMAILGTGDELAEAGRARATPGAIPESVSLGVAALAQDWGAEVVARRRLPDDLALLAQAAAEALAAADLVVVTGGASVGEKDFAKPMFGDALELVFSRVAIKPGKPVWFGRAGGKLVMGLPGNPTSAMVTARLLLAPLLAGMSGREPILRWRNAVLADGLPATGNRETFYRAAAEGEAARVLDNQESGAQRALAAADLLIRRRAGAAAAQPGEMVEVIDF
jgi:molybdopterin molybdotransferase